MKQSLYIRTRPTTIATNDGDQSGDEPDNYTATGRWMFCELNSTRVNGTCQSPPPIVPGLSCTRIDSSIAAFNKDLVVS